MTFLHPWAIAVGAAAAAAPMLIHWLTSPRPARMPLSTIRFVREAVHQQRSWRRLRDFIILALRTLAILLLALAVARPQWGQNRQVSDLQQSDALRVVILDVSQSMAAREGSVRRIERARTAATGYLRYRPRLAANLILAAAQPRGVFDVASTNFDALREELARCQVLPQRLDADRALDLAAKMLAPTGESDRRQRELVVISDFQRTNWGGADFSPLPSDTNIQFESVAPAKPSANLAIVGVEGRSADLAGGAQLAVEVGNFSANARKVEVEVSIGKSTWRLSGTAPAGRAVVLTEQIDPRGLGWQPGEARLIDLDDDLPADNCRYFVLHSRPPPCYVLMTRQAAGRRATSSLFLECALAPAAGKHRSKDQTPPTEAKVVRVDPAAYERAAVTAADMILLDHPGKLNPETIALLADLLRRGRPILYVAGEPIDATNLKLLGAAAGSGLQMPVEFTPPQPGQARRDLFFASIRRDSPPFAVFGDSLTPLVGRLRFAGGIGSRRLDAGLESDLLATYNDGTAGIVLTSSDAGSLAVVNADLAKSDLPRTSAFVPMLAELIGRMRQRGRSTDSAVCGELLVAPLPADAGAADGLRVKSSGEAAGAGAGNHRHGRLADEAAGVEWRWASPGPPGVYRVEREGRPVFAAAVNIPAEESETGSLAARALNRLAQGRNAAYRGAEDEGRQRDDFWKWFAVACVACILGELSALLAFKT